MSMRTGSTFKWDPERIIELRKRTGITVTDTAREMNFSDGRLNGLESGKYKPTVDDLISLSEYYHVSINYILGLDDNPGDKYPSYERYLKQGGSPIVRTRGFESCWPYNIYSEVFEEAINYIPNEDQLNGLHHVMTTMLTNRERICIDMYFHDGYTYDAIANKFNVTRERIRQIIVRAVRKLRNPARANYLIYGKEQYDAMMEKAHEARVNSFYKQKGVVPDENRKTVGDYSILELEPSVRAYNCLKRAGAININDVLGMLEDGSIIKVRNLGRKTLLEILEKINEATGQSYTTDQIYENFCAHLDSPYWNAGKAHQ